MMSQVPRIAREASFEMREHKTFWEAAWKDISEKMSTEIEKREK